MEPVTLVNVGRNQCKAPNLGRWGTQHVITHAGGNLKSRFSKGTDDDS